MEKINKIDKVSRITTIMHGVNTAIIGMLSIVTTVIITLLGKHILNYFTSIEDAKGSQIGGWYIIFGMLDTLYVIVVIIALLILLISLITSFVLNLIATIKGAKIYKKRVRENVIPATKKNNVLKIVSNSISIVAMGMMFIIMRLLGNILILFLDVNTSISEVHIFLIEIIVIVLLLLIAVFIGLIVAEAINISMIKKINKNIN